MEKLRSTLKFNGFFSAGSGIILILFPGRLEQLFELESHLIFIIIGIGLIIFSATLFVESAKSIVSRKKVNFIIMQDLGWVVASIVLLLSAGKQISQAGQLIVALVAAIVACFAWLQIKFSRPGEASS